MSALWVFHVVLTVKRSSPAGKAPVLERIERFTLRAHGHRIYE